MCKFKKGDKVVTVRGDGWGSGSKCNSEINFVGEVTGVSTFAGRTYFGVSWPEGIRGSYTPEQLELAPDLSKRRPHYDLIIAWANGADVQWFNTEIGEWQDMKTLSWAEHHQYRIKPSPKDEALEAAKKAFEQAEEAYKKAAEALAKAGG